jgi:hypothetical protein
VSGTRFRTMLGFGAAVVVVAAGGVAALGFGGSEPETPARSTLPPATAEVTETTLTSTEKVSGTLGYGEVSTLSARQGGTVTWLPEPGAVVTRGQVAYRVNDLAVPVLHGGIPPYRPLRSGDSGNDVRQLEENLSALGYGGFTVDADYTDATADVVRAWQQDLGREETGVVEFGDLVVAPGDLRVAVWKAQPGGQAGGPVFTYTGTSRTVTVALDVAKQHLVSQGGKATVTLPDGTTVDGTVTSVGTVATKVEPTAGAAGGGEPSNTIDVRISLADQAPIGRLDAAPVDVTLVSGVKEHALAVPVAALVALAEGGYGVQVVDGPSTRYVAVETGMFADGFVEITGVAKGTVVGVPNG